MTRVKICGITTLDDACFAVEAGADMLGFNFYPKSKRYITPVEAAKIVASVRDAYTEKCPVLVGVFVNEAVSGMLELKSVVGLDGLQLSGDETTATLWALEGVGFKAIRPAGLIQALEDVKQFALPVATPEHLPSILLDAYHPDEYGGTGLQAADEIAQMVRSQVPRLMLAGGLTPENVAARVAAVQPWGVDVASGVESEQPGIKDHARIQAFIQAAKSV
ncbi:MAG: phosphoribosylanthranilate isomerase [Anaerolineae bacterium]|nr:phosphoribosylanthranilate isomerase [Anaerolineae bacterium]